MAAPPLPASPPPPAHRVLVAEDDAAMRALVVETLVRRGYVVESVACGTDLLRRVARSLHGPTPLPLPDLLVTDVRMPGVGGLDVLAALRARDADLPVIVVTAFGEPGVLARARALGATRVLEKPFELDALCHAIQHALDPS